jgi:hypothetical protein
VADAEAAPEAAVTWNVCAPTASPGYVTDPAQAVAVAPSREQDTVVAFAAAKASVADVEIVELAGPEVRATVGAGNTCAAALVHDATA